VEELGERFRTEPAQERPTQSDASRDPAHEDAGFETRHPAGGAPQPAELLQELARANRVLRVQIAGVERWAVIEDAARLRDALGVPLPIGVPTAFLEPVADPVGDLVSRYLRTHGPFTAADAASRLGLGVAVVTDALRRLAADRRAVEGEFRPGASGTEWVDPEVLRRLRARSLAALRREVEPVPQTALGRFLPDWQHVASERGGLRGIDGLVSAIDQLAGLPLPATSWESLVLPSRVRDYSPAMLDELMASGEVLWAGRGELPGGDGWVSLHLAEAAPLTLPEPLALEPDALRDRLLTALAGGGGYFFRQLATAVAEPDAEPLTDTDVARALWELVWAGRVTGDTFTALRARLGATTTRARATPRSRAHRARARVAASLAASAPPTVAGRWSLLPAPDAVPTARATALAEQLLERYGVVTRGAVQAEGVEGGFALVYKVLSSLEETGRVRRGYFVEQLGAAQFATPATVDRLRAFQTDRVEDAPLVAVTLGATDPANPYGAALSWPSVSDDGERARTHRPGRKAGALVVLVDGALGLYVEKGGKTVLDFLDADAEAAREAAAASLASTVRAAGGRLRVERIDGAFAVGTPLGDALQRAGFAPTPQGLRLR
jgi:ATP-dependent Lhr-like helicase